MHELHDLIGVERDLAQVGRAIRLFAQELDAAVVGGYHITCSDETEWPCAEVFQRLFVEEMLPSLKPGHRAPFRSTNLGGRYESGAARMAEQHYATADARQGPKLLVVKINSHVAVRRKGKDAKYGTLNRYGNESDCCGALCALLDGLISPSLEELGMLFCSGGHDRLPVLRDRRQVRPEYRALLAAVINARLQADCAVRDIRDYEPHAPTIFLVLPCVTINRPDADTELVVGQYGVDSTGPTPTVRYRGLDTDPVGYRIRHERGRLRVEDDQWAVG